MEKIEIYFEDISELSEYEAINKGYREDVYIKISTLFFNIAVYDIIRLDQEFTRSIKTYNYYNVPNNLVIVEEVNTDEVIKIIKHLYVVGYFKKTIPIEIDYNSRLYLVTEVLI